jgi:hypothetical protein
MTASQSLDATELPGAAAVIFAAKATRFLSRGSEVTMTVASADDMAEVCAWARWAGHGSRPGASEREVLLVVREGR